MVYQLPSDSLQSSSITNAKINDNAVTTTKINNGAVTLQKCEATLTNALVPIGGIIIWSGNLATAEALTAWAVCDGRTKNNLATPDLRDRFVVGAQTTSGGLYAVNGTGGSKDAVVVEHTHTITDPEHNHGYADFYNGNGGGTGGGGANTGTTSTQRTTGDNSTGIEINEAGEDGTNKNLPPYYALLYIMRVS